jgi:hypothetical protein
MGNFFIVGAGIKKILVTRLSHGMGVNEWIVQVVIWAAIAVLIVVVVEPERFALISTIMTVMILVMC